MRQSQLFTKTRKEAPKDEVSKNAQLLIRGGYIHKEMAGVYTYLPLGLRTLNKINTIIREEMNALGGQEMFLTALQNSELWETTGRWSDKVIDVWFKTELAGGGDVGLGNTHEEAVTAVMKQYISSYKDLPKAVYQIQTKFRNELRAKSGIMRCREFLMKDLYSFHVSQEDLDEFYERAQEAYRTIFRRVGIGDKTFMTFASGGSFAKYSHEFQTVSDAGEDTIYISREKNIAVNDEVYDDEVLADLGLKKNELEEARAIEVGNIFQLGTRFSDPLGLTFKDEEGEEYPAVMGSYGIGPGRLMGTIVEVLSDDRGIVWPKRIAPFSVHLVLLGKDAEVVRRAEAVYEAFQERGVEVLYDDRDLRAGEKFADADLLGMPQRVVVSEKTLSEGKFEVKDRSTGEVRFMDITELLQMSV